MKKTNDNLESYSNLTNAIIFFLGDSFRHLENEVQNEITSEIMNDKWDEIYPSDQDRTVASEIEKKLKSDLEILRSNKNALSEETLKRITHAWWESQDEAESSNMKFFPKKELKGRDLLGHVTNFAFVVEVLLNRHLCFLSISGEIDDFTFNTLDKASVLNKLVHLFKEEIKKKKVSPDKFASLFRLRNLAVHYTRDNSQKFKATIFQLIEIWTETSSLIAIISSKEKVNDVDLHRILNYHINNFVSRFVYKKKKKR